MVEFAGRVATRLFGSGKRVHGRVVEYQKQNALVRQTGVAMRS